MFTFKSSYRPTVARINSNVGYGVNAEGLHVKDRRFDDLCAAMRIVRMSDHIKLGAKVNSAHCESMCKKVTKLLTDNPEWGIDDMMRPLPRRMLLSVFAAFCKEAAQHGGFIVQWKRGWD